MSNQVPGLSVYFRSADGSALYVNLYLASTLRWQERGLVLDQTSAYPAEGVRTLMFREGGGRLDLRLRVPSWATGGFTVTVNEVRQRVQAVPGSYLTLSRNWRRGDRVGISAPYRLRVERALDDPTVQSVFFGPLLLAAQSPEAGFRTFSFTADSGVPNRTRGDGLTFLDVLWTQAPCATSEAFVRAVRSLADGWVTEGRFTGAERDAVVAAATRAGLRG